MSKNRLDIILVKQGFFQSRNAAQAAVLAGDIFVDGQKITKAGAQVNPQVDIEIKQKLKYVSRGGLKLEKALNLFKINPKGKLALDVGASTGGFSDVLLQREAKKVIAIDVGYGQFDYGLRKDLRVILLERTNIRHVTIEQLPFLANIVVVDLSFISVKKVIKQLIELSDKEAEFIILIKPQFEVGPKLVGKGGIVKDPQVHKDLLEEMGNYFTNIGLRVCGVTYSPIVGAKGNIEFLKYLRKVGHSIKDIDREVNEVVNQAHAVGKG